jgi:hypothetical protein
MIACVTFETTKITDPAKYYEATKIHIIHSASEKNQDSVYWDFYNHVCDVLRENRNDIVIVDQNMSRVSDFALMLKTVLNIIEKEKEHDPDCDIYVNISAGTSEYAAAAAIASMMDPGTILFSVGTAKYMVPEDKVKDYFYRAGKPVGLTDKTKEPSRLASYYIQKPDRNLVCGLRVLSIRTENNKSTKGPEMIFVLKENGLWYRETGFDRPGSDTKGQGEAVYYHRYYVEKWLKERWIVKNEFRKRYELTPLGRNIIDTFHPPSVDETPEKYLVDKPRSHR